MLMATTTKKSVKPAQKKESKLKIILIPLAIYFLPQLLIPILLTIFLGPTPSEQVGTYVSMLTLVISAIIMAIVYRKRIAADAKRLNKGKHGIGFIIGISFLTLLANIVTMNIIKAVTGGTTDNQEAVTESLKSALVLTAVVALITAPINEEMICRAMFGKLFKNNILFYALSSLFFGLLHTNFNPFTIQIIPYIVMALGFGFVFRKTDDNVVASMIAHFINNTLAVISVLLLS